jgi:hypothetical protein
MCVKFLDNLNYGFQRKLFWSDWNREEPKIESANLDGSDRQIVAKTPQVKLPNSLALSLNSGEICYADAGVGNQKIECKLKKCLESDEKIKVKFIDFTRY